MSVQDPRYAKRWRLDHARGIKRLIDVTPTRAHIHQLLLDGASVRGIGEVAGVSPSVISRIRNGQNDTINRTTAARLQAVTMEGVRRRDLGSGFVPKLGAVRRIQALLALGWRHQDITAAMGLATTSQLVVHQRGDWINRDTHDAVRSAYEAMSMTRGPSARTRGRSAKLGHVPPLAWDDDTIDDPAATPDTGIRETRRRAHHIVEDAVWLHTGGLSPHQIAAQLGLELGSVEKAFHRTATRIPWVTAASSQAGAA